jgi:flagellar basal body P-ring formation protein FlgA
MALDQTPPARPGARQAHRQHLPVRWSAMLRRLALVGSALGLAAGPAAAQVSASGTMLAPQAASAPGTGHFVSGVADAMPKIPNHTQNTSNGPAALQMPSHPLVLHPVMPTLPVIEPPHRISIAVSAGNQGLTQTRSVAPVTASVVAPIAAPISTPISPAAPTPAAATPAPQPNPHAAANPSQNTLANIAVPPSVGGLLPAPRIDPSIGSPDPAPANSSPAPAATAAASAPVPALAPNGTENNEAIRASADQFLRQQTAGLPGQVGINVTAIAPRGLSACDSLEAFLPPGARLWGRTTVGVRCIGAHPWVMYLQALISVKATYFVASRDIAANQVIQAGDLTPREGDLTNLPRSVVTDLSQIIGKSSMEHISTGLLLRQDMLHTVAVIQAGQTVKLEVQGSGFSASYEGDAVSSGGTGDSVKVRTPSGQLVNGIVKDRDTVEIPL